MVTQLRPILSLLGVMSLLTGVAYPLVVTGAADLLAPSAAAGSLLRRGGQVVGSALIAQKTLGPGYLHPRPSAVDYDARNSGGSNLAPSNAALISAVQTRAAAYRAANGVAPPMDAVTSSASGLDPDISLANALDQAGRIALARHASPLAVRRLLLAQVTRPLLGLYGTSRLNVLRANLALDAAFPASPNPNGG